MIYNYLTRKKIIFKAPKEPATYGIPNGEMVVTIHSEDKEKPASAPVTDENENHFTTAASFEAIWKEEVHRYLPESKKMVKTMDARQMVREELNQYETEHGRSLKADNAGK